MNKDIQLNIGDVIVVAGDIGLNGTKIMAESGRSFLKKRYNENFISHAERLSEKAKDAEVIKEMLTPYPFVEVEDGGIFKALWDVSKEYRIGFDVDIFAIPVRQETIELANFFDINPYEMTSEKCFIAFVKGGVSLVRKLREAGVPAAIVGEIIAGNDKIVRHQDGASCLRPAKQDSIEEFYKRIGDVL